MAYYSKFTGEQVDAILDKTRKDSRIIIGRAIGRNAQPGDRYFCSTGVTLKISGYKNLNIVQISGDAEIFTVPTGWPDIYDTAVAKAKFISGNNTILNGLLISDFPELGKHCVFAGNLSTRDVRATGAYISNGAIVVDKVFPRPDNTTLTAAQLYERAGLRKRKTMVKGSPERGKHDKWFYRNATRSGIRDEPRIVKRRMFRLTRYSKIIPGVKKLRIYPSWRGRRSTFYEDWYDLWQMPLEQRYRLSKE